eukprot:TRINITY_DN9658_c0_g2_i1.p1 TRINITY_DN9658_c0_g2~~TRINITY_DN9658_c0_g2_i1.p1  ORF type:complete len:171 (-),score=24.32 TRINITY_DN9658_c0_g2_i1:211-723(-)
MQGQWSTIKTTGHIPTPRLGHTSFFYEGHLFVFGGADGENVYNDLHSLDTTTSVWRKIETSGELPSNRYEHTSVLIREENKLVVFGGADQSRLFNDVYVLSLITMNWKKLATSNKEEQPDPRNLHASIWLPQHQSLLVMGGGKQFDIPSDQGKMRAYLLNLETVYWNKVI